VSLSPSGAVYLVTNFNNIMDALQLVFSVVNAPLFATFLLGMFSKRTTRHAAFTGLLPAREPLCSSSFPPSILSQLELPTYHPPANNPP
jgi:Sodium:solute symporter family